MTKTAEELIGELTTVLEQRQSYYIVRVTSAYEKTKDSLPNYWLAGNLDNKKYMVIKVIKEYLDSDAEAGVKINTLRQYLSKPHKDYAALNYKPGFSFHSESGVLRQIRKTVEAYDKLIRRQHRKMKK